jgi:hypothetical protein
LFPDLGDLSTGDGGVDAAKDALAESATPSSSCDATFCDDFDEGGLADRWDNVVGDGSLLVLGPPALSQPRSLGVTIDDAGEATQFLQKQLTPTQRLHCTFQLFAETMPTDLVDIFVIYHPGATFVSKDTIFYLKATGAAMREDVTELDGGCACPGYESNATPFATGFWAPVDIVYDFQNITWSINGVSQTGPIRATAPRSVDVWLGIRVYGAQSVNFHVDDLVCQVE